MATDRAAVAAEEPGLETRTLTAPLTEQATTEVQSARPGNLHQRKGLPPTATVLGDRKRVRKPCHRISKKVQRRVANKSQVARPWSERQRRYLAAFVETIQAGEIPVQRTIATLAGIDPTLVSKWNRDPAFREEVERLRSAAQPVLVERAHAGMLRHAERGNVVAYREVMMTLERQGRISTVPPPAEHDAGGGVHVHIHGIPERRPLSEARGPLTLPSPSAPAERSAPAATPAVAARSEVK